MSKNLLIAIGIIAIVAILTWLLSSKEAVVKTEEPLPDEAISSVKSGASPSTPKTKKVSKENDFQKIAKDSDTNNPLADENFKAQIVNIAYQYNQTAQYPIGSQPITNPDDVRDSKPFEETETTTPFSTENGTVNLSAATDKFQYFDEESIQLQLKVAGAPSDSYISAEALIINPNARDRAPIPITVAAIGTSHSQLLGILDTSTLSEDTLAPEMLIEITVTVDNDPLFTTLSFRYNQASAKVLGVGDVRPNGANLDIPLNIDVAQKGYYFVRAVLEDQSTKRPLIALQQEGKLSKGRDELILQAHIQALKTVESEGPYNLRSIDIYRGAEQGEQFDTSGNSAEEQYTVEGFPFSQYIDEPHQDPLAQQRAEFLLKLATQEDN